MLAKLPEQDWVVGGSLSRQSRLHTLSQPAAIELGPISQVAVVVRRRKSLEVSAD